MIDTDRQLPSPSATAWSFDLAPLGGPCLVVLTTDKATARTLLAQHLADLGKVESPTTARGLIAAIPTESVTVLW